MSAKLGRGGVGARQCKRSCLGVAGSTHERGSRGRFKRGAKVTNLWGVGGVRAQCVGGGGLPKELSGKGCVAGRER